MHIPALATRAAVAVTATAAAGLVGVLPAVNGVANDATAPAAAPAVPVSPPATVEPAVSHAMSKITDALPAATDGANVLRLGVHELLGSGPAVQAAVLSAPLVADPPAAAALAPDPVVVDATSLIKATDQRAAAARAAEQATRADRAADAAKKATSGVVRMITGRLTSGFGARWGSRHQGLDIAAPIGTPIRVPLAGTVISSGPASGFGRWVRVKHADGTITVYGHINRSLVRVGQKVAAAQKIAEVGNRGRSTGPHLHIEVITPGGTKINPRPWLDQHNIGY